MAFGSGLGQLAHEHGPVGSTLASLWLHFWLHFWLPVGRTLSCLVAAKQIDLIVAHAPGWPATGGEASRGVWSQRSGSGVSLRERQAGERQGSKKRPLWAW